MGSKKRALLVTALVAVVVLAGCQTGPQTEVPEETPTSEELRQKVISASESVETAAFTMDMNMDAAGTSIQMNADGQMDIPAQLMKMDLDMNAGGRNIKATQYIDGTTAYIKVNGQWQTQDLSEMSGDIWSTNQVAQQQAALEQGEIRINGTEVIDNRHTYRLEVEVNESVARQLLRQGAASATGSLENVEINGLEFTQYVDVETFHVRKVDMQMDMTIQGRQATADMTMTMSNFNEDVNIQVPDEAKSA